MSTATTLSAVPAQVTIDTVRQMPTAIVPGDFDGGPRSQERKGIWTQGPLRHISEALAGGLVLVVLDKDTGHAVVGRLGKVASTVNCRYGIEVYVPGRRGATVYHAAHLGVIIPLEGTAKWAALQTWRDERSAAIAAARAQVSDPEAGKWEASSLSDVVVVSRVYQDGSREHGFRHWSIRLADLEAGA